MKRKINSLSLNLSQILNVSIKILQKSCKIFLMIFQFKIKQFLKVL